VGQALMIVSGVGLIAAGLVAAIFVPSDWALLALVSFDFPGLFLFVTGKLKPHRHRIHRH
jgi:hypothetical protein